MNLYLNDCFNDPIIKKIKKFLIIFFIISFCIIIPIICIRNYESTKESESLVFSGIINYKTYQKNKKSLFIKVDSCWFGIMNYQLEKYISLNDSIEKLFNKSTILVHRKDSSNQINSKTFDNSFIFKVKEDLLLKQLEKTRIDKRQITRPLFDK